MASEDIALRIALKDEISGGLKKIDNDFKKMGDSASDLESRLTGLVKGFIAFETARRAIVGIFNVTVELDKQMARLEGATKRAGLSWAESAPQIDKFTKSLETTKGVIDDYSRESLVRALDYTKNLGKAMDITTAAADLAAAKEMDLVSATDLLGKAYLGKTEMLGRYGIVIDAAIPDGAKFAAVMTQVNERFGGAAAAQLETYTTKIAVLKDRFEDIGEAIGKRSDLKELITDLSVGLGVLSNVIDGEFKGAWEVLQEESKRENAAYALANLRREAEAVGPALGRAAIGLERFGGGWKKLSTEVDTGVGVAPAIKYTREELELLSINASKNGLILSEWATAASLMKYAAIDAEKELSKLTATMGNDIGKKGDAEGGDKDQEKQEANSNKANKKRVAAAKTANEAIKQDYSRMHNTIVEGAKMAVANNVGALLDGQIKLAEVFKNIAKDFFKYFVTEVIQQVAGILVKKLLKLLKIFDEPENDAMAMRVGRDYGRFFTQGATEAMTAGAAQMAYAMSQSQRYMVQSSQPNVERGGGQIVVNIIGAMTPKFIRDHIIETIQRQSNNGMNGIKYATGFNTGASAVAFN